MERLFFTNQCLYQGDQLFKKQVILFIIPQNIILIPAGCSMSSSVL